jgi:hypothetical protein
VIRSQSIRVAGIAVAGLGIAFSGLTFASTATAATKPEIIACDGKGQVKPKEIILACGDGNTFVSKIKWNKWNSNTATGTGTLRWNTCLPQTCAGGIVQKYKAKITLGGLASAPGETDVFSEMTLTFTQGGPGMVDQGIYELSNSRR